MKRLAYRVAARAGLFLAVMLGCALASRAVAGMLYHVEPTPLPSVESFDYDAAMVRVSGRLSTEATRALARVAEGDTGLAVVITAVDVQTCEDLGRQLRELRRAYGPNRRIAVWGDSVKPEVLERFLRRERIGGVTVSPIPLTGILADRKRMWSPAAIVATRDGRIIDGVGHTLRARNVRLRSFAEELKTLSHRSPSGTSQSSGPPEQPPKINVVPDPQPSGTARP